MKEKLKSTTGITLVALVITIIILLILATVTIRIVLSERIIKRAQNATESYNTAQTNELAQLNDVEAKMKQFGPKESDPNWWVATDADKVKVLQETEVEIGGEIVRLGEYLIWGSESKSDGSRISIYTYNNQVMMVYLKKDGSDYISLAYIPEWAKDLPEDITEGAAIEKTNHWCNYASGFDLLEPYNGKCPISVEDYKEYQTYSQEYLQKVTDSFNQ